MRIDREDFRKIFPHLAEELEKVPRETESTSIRVDLEKDETDSVSKFQGYLPDVIDFLRRCETEDEGLEIINYLETRLEIDHQYAEKLRRQLSTKGIRSFGKMKGNDYYLKKGGYG